MATQKTVPLNLRIHPEKKAALMALAEKQRTDVTKLVLPQIDLLLETAVKDLPALPPLTVKERKGRAPTTHR